MSLIARVVEQTDTRAILEFPDGQRLTVERSELPADAAVGGSVTMVFGSEVQTREHAKTLLNEILHPSTP